jgi:hypothetical protein
VAGHPPEILDDIVIGGDCQGQVYLLRQGLHTFQAMPVLGKWVDIRVIPETSYLVSLMPPVLDGIGGAVGAADVD